MAKKKGESSNLGLIITLVFFVLSTVILGVTTYMGFSAQEEKDKAVAKANQEKTVAEKDKSWYRDQVRVVRTWLDGTAGPGVEATDVAKALAEILEGKHAGGAGQKDKEDVEKLFKDLQARLPWDPVRSNSPPRSMRTLVTQKDQEIQGLLAKLKCAQDAAAAEK